MKNLATLSLQNICIFCCISASALYTAHAAGLQSARPAKASAKKQATPISQQAMVAPESAEISTMSDLQIYQNILPMNAAAGSSMTMDAIALRREYVEREKENGAERSVGKTMSVEEYIIPFADIAAKKYHKPVLFEFALESAPAGEILPEGMVHIRTIVSGDHQTGFMPDGTLFLNAKEILEKNIVLSQHILLFNAQGKKMYSLSISDSQKLNPATRKSALEQVLQAQSK
jgi:hypothetical protein